jgi:hypothetical protein
VADWWTVPQLAHPALINNTAINLRAEMKEHPTYRGYFVTEDGRVYSSHSKRELSQQTDRDGYKRTTLKRYNKKAGVHRLVAETYISNPDNKSQINHIDRDPSNNHISNLEWVTPKENIEHKIVNQNLWTIEYIPTGQVWQVNNLFDFCKEHGLSYCLRETLNQDRGRTQHKGFRIIKKESISALPLSFASKVAIN